MEKHTWPYNCTEKTWLHAECNQFWEINYDTQTQNLFLISALSRPTIGYFLEAIWNQHVLDGYYLVGRDISALSLLCCLMACCMFEGSVTHKEYVHVLKYAKAEPLAFPWPLEYFPMKFHCSWRIPSLELKSLALQKRSLALWLWWLLLSYRRTRPAPQYWHQHVLQ